jgi:hypothetical protein
MRPKVGEKKGRLCIKVGVKNSGCLMENTNCLLIDSPNYGRASLQNPLLY